MARSLDPSDLPRLAFSAAHALAFGAALWILAGGIRALVDGAALVPPLGDEVRRAVLTGCGAVFLLKTRLSTGPLLWRPFGWRTALAGFAVASAYQVGFALAGASATAPMEGWGDQAGLLLFLLGSGLSIGVEVARNHCMGASPGRSALCTRGAFTLVRHPDLLGDLLWGLGWALLTRSPAALLLPALVAATHGSRTAADVDRLLEEQEGPLFRAWATRTKRLIPFLY